MNQSMNTAEQNTEATTTLPKGYVDNAEALADKVPSEGLPVMAPARNEDTAPLNKEAVQGPVATTPDPENVEPEAPAEKMEQQTPFDFIDCFHTDQGEPWVSARYKNVLNNMSMVSKQFEQAVYQYFYMRGNKNPKRKEVTEYITRLRGQALFEGEQKQVHIRTAYHEGNIYIDIGNKLFQQIRISAGYWEVISSLDSPVKFLRTKRQCPLPMPEPDGSLDLLKPFVNLESEHDWILLICWIIGAFSPTGPYPLLIFYGEQGSGKSFVTKLIGDLIDPLFPRVTSVPRTERDFAISASSTRLLCYDNLSGLPSWMGDCLCRAATGGGFVTRKLRTDMDEMIFRFKKPVILNGISSIFTQHDLADRSVFLRTKQIPQEMRRPEKNIHDEWIHVKGLVFGAICTAIATALAYQDNVNLDSAPRMADFAYWVKAAESSLPIEEGRFLAEYEQNRLNVVDNALEDDVVGSTIKQLAEHHGEWSGSPTELLTEMKTMANEDTVKDKGWPKQPNVLSLKINRVTTYLREKGIQVESTKSGTRKITVRYLGLKNNQA